MAVNGEDSEAITRGCLQHQQNEVDRHFLFSVMCEVLC